MTTIKAKGETEYGYFDVTITGEKMVREVKAETPEDAAFIRKRIHNADGWIANAYYPEPDTMLQAFALCVNMFGDNNVTVDGELEAMECEDGVIY